MDFNPYDIADDDPVYLEELAKLRGGAKKQNDPGFVTGIKQGLGGFTSGIGQVGEDLGWKNNPIKSYGDEVQANNPSSAASQSWEGFKESPWQGVKEFAGQGIGSTLPSLAAFLLPGGQGAAATGLARVGQVARGLPMQTALAAAPIYGQVREDQQHQGFDDIPAAAAAAIGGGIVESKLGIQRVLGKATDKPIQSFVGELASSPLKTGLKTWGRTGLEEGAEEIIQQPMQQLGAHRNPLTEESLRDTAWSGFGGSIGGLAMGGVGGAKMGLAHKRVDTFRQADLLNPETPLDMLDKQAQWNQAFIERDQGAEAGQRFYDQRQGEIDQYVESLVDPYRRQAFADQNRQIDLLADQERIAARAPSYLGQQSDYNPDDERVLNAIDRPNPADYRNWWENVPDPTNPEAYQQFWQHVTDGQESVRDVKRDALGTPLNQELPPGYVPVSFRSNGNATTQVAQESGQGASGVAGGSTGNTQDQSGVGRGGNELAATPVLGSGTDQSVGDTRVGNGAGVNVTEPAQVVAQAQKANDAKAGTKSGTAQDGARTLAETLLGLLKPGRKSKKTGKNVDYRGVLQTYLGFDGTNDGKLEEVAKVHGYDNRQDAYNIIFGRDQGGKHYAGAIERLYTAAIEAGYTVQQANEAMRQLGLDRENQYDISEDQKEIARLTGALETGIGSEHQGKLGFSDAAQQGMLYRELRADPVTDSAGESENLGGNTAISEAKRLAAEQELDKATTEEVANSGKIKGTKEERGLTVEEIRAKRAAEAQAKADAKDGNLEEPKARGATLATKYEHSVEDYAKAGMLWDELIEAGNAESVTWADASQEIKDSYTQAVKYQLSHPSGHIDFSKLDKLQEYLNYEQSLREKAVRSSTTDTGSAGELSSAATSTDRRTQSAETEEVVQSSGSESTSEEVTADGIVSRWNQGAKALGVTDWDGLSSEQQNYILGSGTWAEFDEAAAEVLDEINDDQGAAKFSEADKQPTNEQIDAWENGMLTLDEFMPTRFPAVDSAEISYPGPGGRFTPKAIRGAAFYRETNGEGLFDLLAYDKQYNFNRTYVATKPEIALGQGGNTGINVVFRSKSLSGTENVKPGTGKIAGREYVTEVIAPRAVVEVKMSPVAEKGLRPLVKRVLASEFNRTVEDGQILFTRKIVYSRQSAGFSEAKTDQGVDPQKLSTTLRKLFFSSEKFNKLVSIYPNAEAIPADVKAAAAADAHMSINDVPWEQVQGFAMNGKVYLVAGNIKEGSELGVFLHELGVHVGMEKLVGKANMQRLSSQIEQWAAKDNGSQESKLAKDAVRRAEGSASKDRQREVIAYFVEEAVNAGINPTAIQKTNSPLAQWFRSLWAAAKVALRKIGLGRFDQLTAQNLVDLSYGAARLELEGTWHGTAADFRNFNHEYMGTGEANAGVGERTKNVGAFGWGTYVAQRPGIAKAYWEADMRRKGGQLRIEEKYNLQLGTNVYSVMDGFDLVKRFNSKDAAEKFYRENKREGSLMRVDTAVHEDEMLDWDKPLSEQSEVVKEALAEAKFMPDDVKGAIAVRARELIRAAKNLPAYATLSEHAPQTLKAVDALEDAIYDKKPYYEVLNLVTALRNDAFGSQIPNIDTVVGGLNKLYDSMGNQTGASAYEYLTSEKGSDKAASEYLDSIGIKGIKFLDAQSREFSGKWLVDAGGRTVSAIEASLSREKRSTLGVDHREIKDALQFVESFDSLDEALEEAIGKSGPFGHAYGMSVNAKIIKAWKELGWNLGSPNQTRNLVIFNDKNIQRVVTQVGADRERIKFSKTAQAIKQYGGESGVQAWEDASGVASHAFKWFMSLHDLVGKYGGVLPSAKGWYDSVRATAAARNRIKEDAESIAARAGKLNKVVLKQLNEFISKSTYEQKWGYDATFDKLDGTKRDVKADPEMAKLFRALPKDAQEIAKAVFAHGAKMKIEKFKIMKQLGLDKDTFLEQGSLTGPYAPLKRFGDYVAILKSKELRAAEQAGDTKKVEELKANPDHYVVSNFDTLGQAKKFARVNEATFGWSDAFKGSINVEVGHRMKPETLQKVLAAVKAEDLPSNVKGQVETMVREMYLSAFDEHNARMSGLKRKNRAGYDADMIRSFLAHARAEAGFLSNMQHGGKTNELFYKLQQEAKNDDGKRTGQDVFNAIAQHYAANLDHKDTPIQDRVLAFTSIMQLATNPAYHFQNYMQPLMVSLPRLAADFNDYGGAWNAMRQGHAISREMVKGNIFKLETEIDLSVVKNTKLREMLQTAADAGLLDVGMDEDLANFESTRTGYELVDNASNGMKKIVHKLRQMSRRVEATNRISAAVAAYNMSYGRNKDHAKATEYAISVLQDTQGDFSKTDAPLIIKRLPKFMVQYRKFQLMMAAHYVKAFNDAFRSEDAETRAVGRRTLLISLGHALGSAGVMGLPLMNVVGLIFKATGSDDEPRDLERTLREMFGDNANYLLRGPFWFMGLDAKLSQDKVFSILPYADWDLTSRKGVTNLVMGAMGPSGSNALRMAEGFGKMAEGDYYKGLTGILPSGLANGIKAFQVANKGYTLKNGDVMVKPEDIETFQLMLDSIGMKSPEMRRMDWYKNQQWEVKQFYSDRSKEIQRQYADAFKEKDTAQLAELRQEWMDLQAGKEHLRYLFGDNHDELKRQPLSNLIKYPQTVANRERKLQRSVAE